MEWPALTRPLDMADHPSRVWRLGLAGNRYRKGVEGSVNCPFGVIWCDIFTSGDPPPSTSWVHNWHGERITSGECRHDDSILTSLSHDSQITVAMMRTVFLLTRRCGAIVTFAFPLEAREALRAWLLGSCRHAGPTQGQHGSSHGAFA